VRKETAKRGRELPRERFYVRRNIAPKGKPIVVSNFVTLERLKRGKGKGMLRGVGRVMEGSERWK